MAYNPKALEATAFIDHEYITETIKKAKEIAENKEKVQAILEKARDCQGLSFKDVAVLLEVEDESVWQIIFKLAKEIKEKIYGQRIVMFAPLYLSNYCVNECVYCGYCHSNQEMHRIKLTQEEIVQEVKALQDMGHKRLALEVGEDYENAPIEYILESIKSIYGVKHKNGAIRRVNVNIAATTVENYKKLTEAEIGTYILFQETYHKETYEKVHPKGPKHNYNYHTEAMDRAMQGGIDDVGIGVLYGLYDYKYDTVAMLMHAEHLEATYGVGPHTISVPRLKKAGGMELNQFEHLVDDKDFLKIVSILRVAVPYTGIIISTRESQDLRAELLKHGVSQISGGSCTGVGGYSKTQEEKNTSQFQVTDERTLGEIVSFLCENDYIPSFCTACYREGRTGERFMRLAKTGQIGNICQANALITLKEYGSDYASQSLQQTIERLIDKEIEKIPSEKVKQMTESIVTEITSGKRDFRF